VTLDAGRNGWLTLKRDSLDILTRPCSATTISTCLWVRACCLSNDRHWCDLDGHTREGRRQTPSHAGRRSGGTPVGEVTLDSSFLGTTLTITLGLPVEVRGESLPLVLELVDARNGVTVSVDKLRFAAGGGTSELIVVDLRGACGAVTSRA